MKVEREQYSDGYCGNCGKKSESRWQIIDDDGDLVLSLCHSCLMKLLDAIVKRD